MWPFKPLRIWCLNSEATGSSWLTEDQEVEITDYRQARENNNVIEKCKLRRAVKAKTRSGESRTFENLKNLWTEFTPRLVKHANQNIIWKDYRKVSFTKVNFWNVQLNSYIKQAHFEMKCCGLMQQKLNSLIIITKDMSRKKNCEAHSKNTPFHLLRVDEGISLKPWACVGASGPGSIFNKSWKLMSHSQWRNWRKNRLPTTRQWVNQTRP